MHRARWLLLLAGSPAVAAPLPGEPVPVSSLFEGETPKWARQCMATTTIDPVHSVFLQCEVASTLVLTTLGDRVASIDDMAPVLLEALGDGWRNDVQPGHLPIEGGLLDTRTVIADDGGIALVAVNPHAGALGQAFGCVGPPPSRKRRKWCARAAEDLLLPVDHSDAIAPRYAALAEQSPPLDELHGPPKDEPPPGEAVALGDLFPGPPPAWADRCSAAIVEEVDGRMLWIACPDATVWVAHTEAGVALPTLDELATELETRFAGVPIDTDRRPLQLSDRTADAIGVRVDGGPIGLVTLVEHKDGSVQAVICGAQGDTARDPDWCHRAARDVLDATR